MLVMEFVLRSFTEETVLITPSLKAFMDQVTVLTKTDHTVKIILERIEDLIL